MKCSTPKHLPALEQGASDANCAKITEIARSAWRSLPQSRAAIVEIGATELAVDPAKIDAFKGWCLSSDIEWQDPEWLLCRMYTTAGSFRPWLNSTINSPRSCL